MSVSIERKGIYRHPETRLKKSFPLATKTICANIFENCFAWHNILFQTPFHFYVPPRHTLLMKKVSPEKFFNQNCSPCRTTEAAAAAAAGKTI